MKHIFAICLLLAITVAAQSQKRTFVRVFDESGHKTHKGFITATSDNSLTLMQNKMETEIPITQIAAIKLKRSFGHTLLISSLIGGASFAIVGIATADPDAWLFGYTAGEGAVAGLAFGGTLGLLTGSIAGALSHGQVYNIDMSQEKWIKVKEVFNQYIPVTSKK